MLHRACHLFVRQQTAVINSIRAYLAEFGIVAPVGRKGVEQLLEVVTDTADHRLPEVARMVPHCAGQPIALAEGPDTGVRSPHHRLASVKCDEQAT